MCPFEFLKSDVGKFIEGKLHAHQRLVGAPSFGKRHANFTGRALTLYVASRLLCAAIYFTFWSKV